MKKENIRKLIDHLLSVKDDRFDFGVYWAYTLGDQIRFDDANLNQCGTAGCLAGHIRVLFGEAKGIVATYPSNGAYWLGLTLEQAAYLFLGKWTLTEMGSITKAECVGMLQSLITFDTFQDWRERNEEYLLNSSILNAVL